MPDFDQRKRIIELTLAIYRITGRFPQGEILKEKIRERSLDLAGRFIAWQFCLSPTTFQEIGLAKRIPQKVVGDERGNQVDWYSNIIADFEVLEAYFEVAKVQNWLDSTNFDILSNEYQKIMAEVKASFSLLSSKGGAREAQRLLKVRKISKTMSPAELKEREKAIVDCFRGNGSMKVGELATTFSSLSKRTIRRDIEKLCDMGILERIGSYNETTYKLKEGALGQVSQTN